MKLFKEVKDKKEGALLLWLPGGKNIFIEPYELPTEEEIRKIIYDDAYPKEWKDKTPFEKTRFGEDTAKAITNLLKGER